MEVGAGGGGDERLNTHAGYPTYPPPPNVNRPIVDSF